MHHRLTLPLLLLALVAACGGRERPSGGIDASVPPTDGGRDSGSTPGEDGGAAPDAATADGGGSTEDGGGSMHDAGADAGCMPADRDDDGYDAVACGGDDCDDDDPLVHPGALDGPDRTAEIIDSIPGYEGQEIAAALDGAGDLHVAYHWRNTGGTDEGLRYLRLTAADVVADREDAHRSTDPLRSRVGRDAAIAIDSSRVPHVSFVDQRNTGAFTFFTGSREGGTWSFESPAGGTQGTALALAPDDSKHIAVTGVTYLTDASGSFTNEPVATGRNPRIAYDPSGTVHVVYAAADGIRHAMRDTGGWTDASIQDFAVGPPPIPGLTLTMDGAGTLHVAYGTGTEIVYAQRPAGGAWTRETVTATGWVPHAVAVLADGRVGIAFIENVSGAGYTMRFAFSTPSGWHVVDDTSACGCYDVAMVERDGRMSIVYSAGGNLALGTFVTPDGVDDDCDGTAW